MSRPGHGGARGAMTASRTWQAAPAIAEETLRRYYDALLRKDLDGAVALLDEDVVFEVGTGTYEGRSAVKRWLREMGTAWDDFQMAVERYLVVGDHVVVLLGFRARGRASGVELSQRPAHVWRIVAGTPTRMVSYADRARAACAAGLDPAALGVRGALR